MKFKYIIAMIAAVAIFMSCEGDYTAPHEELSDSSGFVRFDEIIVNAIDLQGGVPFQATVVAPADNIASYVLEGTLVEASGEISDPFQLKSFTSFPVDLSVSVEDIAAASGRALDSLTFGDKVNIEATVTNNNGVSFTSEDFTGDLFNPGERQAMQFSVFLSCPFIQSDAVGQYLITRDDFGSTLDPDRLIDAIPGPDANSITFVNLYSHPEGYDVTVYVAEGTADVTIPRQPAWHCDNFGCPYGEGRVDGGGFYFSCSGFMTVNLANTVDAGSFGTYPLELTRQ